MARREKVALVTGAEGFIGSHFVKFLEAEGWTVVATYRMAGAHPFPTLPGVCFEQCDLRNGQRVEQLVRDYQPTNVFHFAAQSLPTVSWADPVGTFESNIMGSLHLLEAIRHQPDPAVLVSACSSAEYGHVPPEAIPVKEDQPLHPLHPYGISKVCLDLLAREYHLDYRVPTVNIRLFNTTGPGKTNDAPSDFVRQAVQIRRGMKEPVFEVGNLTPRRAFLNVRDTVRGFYLAAMKGRRGEVYNLCSTETHEIGRMLETVICLSGITAEIRQSAQLMRPSDEKVIFGDTARIRADTGWQPERTLEQTLSEMLEYWEQAYGAHDGR